MRIHTPVLAYAPAAISKPLPWRYYLCRYQWPFTISSSIVAVVIVSNTTHNGFSHLPLFSIATLRRACQDNVAMASACVLFKHNTKLVFTFRLAIWLLHMFQIHHRRLLLLFGKAWSAPCWR